MELKFLTRVNESTVVPCIEWGNSGRIKFGVGGRGLRKSKISILNTDGLPNR